MKFSDISNERTVLDEGAWGDFAEWAKREFSGEGSKDRAAMKALKRSVSEVQRVAHKAFRKGEDVDVERLQTFFNGFGYGKSGTRVIQKYEQQGVIRNNTLPYDELDTVIASTVQAAILSDPRSFMQKAGVDLKVTTGQEAPTDVDKTAKKKQEKEMMVKLVDKLGTDFRRIINDTDDQELRAIRFQAYRVFRQVADKYGVHLDEPPSISPGFQDEG